MRGTLSEILENSEDLKGELVLIVEGNTDDREKAIDLTEIHQRIKVYIEGGVSASQAIKQVAKDTGMNKNDIYSFYHSKDIKNDHS